MPKRMTPAQKAAATRKRRTAPRAAKSGTRKVAPKKATRPRRPATPTGDLLRLVPETALAALAPEFDARRRALADQYNVDLVDLPVAGWCLRNYIVLTEFPDRLPGPPLSDADRFWNRYYWLARFARVWKAADPAGYDGGVEDDLNLLLEDDAFLDGDRDLRQFEAAVRRDAARQVRAARGT